MNQFISMTVQQSFPSLSCMMKQDSKGGIPMSSDVIDLGVPVEGKLLHTAWLSSHRGGASQLNKYYYSCRSN